MKEKYSQNTLSIPMVKAAFLAQFKTAMDNSGVAIEPYFKKFRLPLSLPKNPEAFLPEKPFWGLINQVAIEEMIPDFGMRVAQVTPWHQVKSIQPYINHCENLEELIRVFCRLASSQSLLTHFIFLEGPQVSKFEYQGTPLINHDIQMELYRVTSMIELIQSTTGECWRPLKVELMMDENKVVKKASILDDLDLVFSQDYTAISLPSSILHAPIRINVDKTNTIPNIDNSKIETTSSFLNALRELLSLYITEDDLSIDVFADIIGVSTRSFQRTIKKNHSRFNGLLNEARYCYACEQLKDPTTKITDISNQLGYSDTAHFTRAFKRWSGVSPKKYRNQLASGKD